MAVGWRERGRRAVQAGSEERWPLAPVPLRRAMGGRAGQCSCCADAEGGPGRRGMWLHGQPSRISSPSHLDLPQHLLVPLSCCSRQVGGSPNHQIFCHALGDWTPTSQQLCSLTAPEELPPAFLAHTSPDKGAEGRGAGLACWVQGGLGPGHSVSWFYKMKLCCSFRQWGGAEGAQTPPDISGFGTKQFTG